MAFGICSCLEILQIRQDSIGQAMESPRPIRVSHGAAAWTSPNGESAREGIPRREDQPHERASEWAPSTGGSKLLQILSACPFRMHKAAWEGYPLELRNLQTPSFTIATVLRRQFERLASTPPVCLGELAFIMQYLFLLLIIQSQLALAPLSR